MTNEAREAIAKIICHLSDVENECDFCKAHDGCPDQWKDIKDEVAQILSLKYPDGSPMIAVLDPEQDEDFKHDYSEGWRKVVTDD